ncbi:carbohydrate porin [Escherichia coli]
MMKEGRGRSNAGGNFLVSKQLDNWYFELNTFLKTEHLYIMTVIIISSGIRSSRKMLLICAQ